MFFDWNKAVITKEAADILTSAAQAFKDYGGVTIQLSGFADTSGKPDYNQGLSERRAAAARAFLAKQGVPESAIASEAFGETRLRVETADNVREPQNRRVEIVIPQK